MNEQGDGGRASARVLTVSATVKVPRVPNFLLTESGQSFPLCAFEEDSLRELGAEWIENLIERSREQKADSKAGAA